MDLFIPLYAQLHFTTRGFLFILISPYRKEKHNYPEMR